MRHKILSLPSWFLFLVNRKRKFIHNLLIKTDIKFYDDICDVKFIEITDKT